MKFSSISGLTGGYDYVQVMHVFLNSTILVEKRFPTPGGAALWDRLNNVYHRLAPRTDQTDPLGDTPMEFNVRIHSTA